MCSDGWQQYRFGPGWKVTVLWPEACKNGHAFGPGTGTGSWSTPHMVYICNQCYAARRDNYAILWAPRPREWLVAHSLAQAIRDGVVPPGFRLPGFPDVIPHA
jgi:hypothetical protein